MEQKSISSDLIRGHIDTIILHTLLSGDKFAQQISDTIEEKSENQYKINQATLYSSLKRLETLKQVTSYWFDCDGGRRKYFKLTDAGKGAVENNLSNWSYSRAIIDKLMDNEQEPQIKAVEVVVEKQQTPIPTPFKDQPVQQIPSEFKTAQEKLNELFPQQAQKSHFEAPTQNKPIASAQNSEIKQEQVATSSAPIEKQETVQEINFRNILSGLIKSTVAQKQPPQQLKPISAVKEEIVVEKNVEEKLKFNETITDNSYDTKQKSNRTGKIDFNDLVLRAKKEGYKLRVSSKDSGVAPGKIFINKLNLISTLAIYLFALLEFFLLVTFVKSLNMSAIAVVVVIGTLTLFPIARLFIYFKNPGRMIAEIYHADRILTVAIIVFNLLIVTFALNLLFGADFLVLSSVVPTFIAPCIVYVDVLIYFIIKYILSKFQFCKTSKK